MSKPKLQARMAALSFSEKIKILEKLRDREKAIAAAGLRRDGYTGRGRSSETKAQGIAGRPETKKPTKLGY